MKSVLLIFDDQKELEFIEANLVENDFEVLKSDNLNDALILAEENAPELIVTNTIDNESKLRLFSIQIQTERLKNTTLLSLIELEDYLKSAVPNHFVIKPVRPKLLLSLIRGIMNNETTNWLPSFH